MAAKLFLAESTTATAGTTTVYTVPADKAARIRIMINPGGGGGTKQIAILIGAEGSQTVFSTIGAAEDELWTGFRSDATDAYPKDIGVHNENAGWSITTSTAEKDWIAPLPIDYILSAGDTVQYTITSTSWGTVLFQVMGVEDDA